MRLFRRLLALLILTTMLMSCGWMKSREREDYLDARAGKPLTIPEGLETPRDTAALTIPETSNGKNETEVSDAPPAVALNNEPIVPVASALAPDAAYAKVELALRGTSGFTVSGAQSSNRTFKVSTVVAQARSSSWWSRLTGRDRIDRKGATRTVSVLAASGGGSAVAVQDARGTDDAAARRILVAIRQALR